MKRLLLAFLFTVIITILSSIYITLFLIKKTNDNSINTLLNFDKINNTGIEIDISKVESIFSNVALSTRIMCYSYFNVEDSSNEEKMQIVFDSIKNSDYKQIDNILKNQIKQQSIVYNGIDYVLKDDALYFDRKLIENKYIEIFGDDNKFDKNVLISICESNGQKLFYNEDLDIYLNYSLNNGFISSCRCAWGGSTIYKAYQNNGILTIYTISTSNEVDGMYTFKQINNKYVFTSYKRI